MIEVNQQNFAQYYPAIENSISNAAFMCFDFEFMGLPSSTHPKDVSLFDSPSERYLKICKAIRSFPPCQLGLACFQECSEGYKADVYSIYLLKRTGKRLFSFTTSALSFLSGHQFDFNKLVPEGVSYSNKEEISEIEEQFIKGEIDSHALVEGIDSKIDTLKTRIIQKCCMPILEAGDSSSLMDELHVAQPFDIQLVSCEGEDTEQKSNTCEPLWKSPLSPLESSIVLLALSKEFPHFQIEVNKTGTVLTVMENSPHIDKVELEERWHALLDSLLDELRGVAKIFHAISAKRRPLVGHNSLLDLLYLYYISEGDLPDSYEKWKKEMNNFPVIIDTKILASCMNEKLRANGVTNSSLPTLASFFDSKASRSILPFDTPRVVDGFSSSETEDQYHNAGFDACVTGRVFIKLAHLYAYSRCISASSKDSTDWPFRKLVQLLRDDVINRVPIPLIDAQHCFLSGSDPEGARPDFIRLRKIRRYQFLGLSFVSNRDAGRIIDWLWSRLAGFEKIDEVECERVRFDLEHLFGVFRVEVRLEENSTMIAIAANTANTFARICSLLTDHSMYYLVENDLDTKSFDQRLTASRQMKDSKGNEVSKFKKRSTILFFCIAGASIALGVRVGAIFI